MNLKTPLIRKILGKVEIQTILKKMNGKKLKQTERNYLYRSIRPKLIAAELLASGGILKVINRNNAEDISLIEYNLALYGYPLLAPKKSKRVKKIDLEQLIAEILVKHNHARYIEALPIVMIKNKIDPFKLLEIAALYGIKNKIGYLLETAMLLRLMPYLETILGYLEQTKENENSFLVDGNYEFLKQTSPARIKKWHLLGRFFDEDFQRLAKVYL